ncbi:hypothetical protein B0O80DRAFT_498377 [Mortierella sp. GBAus27b]|nr:hypothetical protein B0O80DRAFT_498377 [Mortierella sp. GBAus27b]
MPVAFSKLERPSRRVSQQGRQHSSLPCPIYSGHLLKLGSNDRWQSRLFTFDGSVLACLGKKPKTPAIMTYDPYVSSPFVSTSHNPNTKWFINVDSITDIKLLPTPRIYRCFPYGDISKELSIQTNDGRNMVLRASKDVDLERWYFVLSRIWEYQQQMGKFEVGSPQSARYLAAHQQSAQLFQKYLKETYPDGQHQAQSPTGSPHCSRPVQKTPGDSPSAYQIPAPPRVSVFMPQGFDWTLHGQSSHDDQPARFVSSFIESHCSPVRREQRLMERQSSWNHHRPRSTFSAAQRRHSGEVAQSLSGAIVHQRSACPPVNSIEPDKAASIDKWRRSLVMPMLVEETIPTSHDEKGYGAVNPVGLVDSGHRNTRDSTSDQSGLRTDSRDMDSTLKHSSLGHDIGADRNSKAVDPVVEWFENNMSVSGKQSSTKISCQERLEGDASLQGHDIPHAQDSVVQGLMISPATRPDHRSKEDDEMPLGLIQANRHSRWFNTQRSSEDSTSPTHQESRTNIVETSHRLLPSEPITPEQCSSRILNRTLPSSAIVPNPRNIHIDRRSHHGHSPSASSSSNPTLSLHGSSYSHLPIHDPDFVYPKSSSTVGDAAQQGSHASASGTSRLCAAVHPPFTVHVPMRQLCSGSSVLNTSAEISRKYRTIDSSSLTGAAASHSNQSVPPPRPSKQKRLARPPSLARSVSVMSSVSQAHASRSWKTRACDPNNRTACGRIKGDDVDREAEEDEPLGVTFSRQQKRLEQKRPVSFAGFVSTPKGSKST